MQLRSAVLVTLLCTAFLPGCDKVKQCNKLIDTINAHTPKMTAATEKFGEITTNPKVVEEYEGVVQGASDRQSLPRTNASARRRGSAAPQSS